MSDEIVKAKIRRALLSGPESVTKDAAVMEMEPDGKMTSHFVLMGVAQGRDGSVFVLALSPYTILQVHPPGK